MSTSSITIIGVGLDSKKRFFSEKMRKDAKRGEKMGKEAIRYGKSAYDIIKFNYFIGIRIWQLFVIKMTMRLKTVFVK